MSRRLSKRRPYQEWPKFSAETPSTALRASMMDLHLYVNNSSWRLAAFELARFVFYSLRLLVSPRVRDTGNGGLLFVVDTPGVGGVLTLLPLLRVKPPQMQVTIAVTDFVHRNASLRHSIGAFPNITLLNIDRARGIFVLNGSFIRATLKMLRRFPRLAPALPLFLCRHHAYSAIARSCLAAHHFDALIVFNERMLPSACFSEVARQRGTPTIAVQHGNFVDNYLPVMVERYLTWGRFHSDWLAQRANCITDVIGSPRLDGATPPVRTAPLLTRTRPLHVVFFSQVGSATVSPEMISATRREILSLVDDATFRVTVKLHPLDSQQSWMTEGPAAARVSYLRGDVSLGEALADADVVCSFYSTILAEALLWDLPVIQLNPFPESVGHFPDRNGITAVTDAKGLRQTVQRWQGSADDLQALMTKQRMLSAGYFSNVGNACQRFWQAVAPTHATAPHQ